MAASSRRHSASVIEPIALRRIAEHGDAGDALGVALGRRAARRRRRRRPGCGPAAGRPARARRSSSRSCSTNVPPSPAQQRHQLVRVDEPAPAGLDELAGVVVERLHRRVGRLGEAHVEPAARLVAEAHHGLDRLAAAGHGEAPADHDLLEAEALGERRQAPGDRRRPRRAGGRRPARRRASPGSTRGGAAPGRSAQAVADARRGSRRARARPRAGRATRPSLVADRRQVADLGDGDEPLVGRVRRGRRSRTGGPRRASRQAGDLEVATAATSAGGGRSSGAARGT